MLLLDVAEKYVGLEDMKDSIEGLMKDAKPLDEPDILSSLEDLLNDVKAAMSAIYTDVVAQWEREEREANADYERMVL